MTHARHQHCLRFLFDFLRSLWLWFLFLLIDAFQIAFLVPFFRNKFANLILFKVIFRGLAITLCITRVSCISQIIFSLFLYRFLFRAKDVKFVCFIDGLCHTLSLGLLDHFTRRLIDFFLLARDKSGILLIGSILLGWTIGTCWLRWLVLVEGTIWTKVFTGPLVHFLCLALIDHHLLLAYQVFLFNFGFFIKVILFDHVFSIAKSHFRFFFITINEKRFAHRIADIGVIFCYEMIVYLTLSWCSLVATVWLILD